MIRLLLLGLLVAGPGAQGPGPSNSMASETVAAAPSTSTAFSGGRIEGPPFAGPSAPGPGPFHDVHISHTRLVLEGQTVALRVRLFHDDLTLALRAFAARPDLEITAEQRADSLFAAYFGRVVKLEADGQPVRVRVTGSGMERDQAEQDVVWYLMEGAVPRTPKQLVILNGLLFDTWRDQQNIVQLLRLPGEERKTLYFTAGDPREQTVGYE